MHAALGRPSSAAADSSPAYENTAARHLPLSLVSPIYPLTLITLLVQGSHMGSRVLASLFAIELGANPFLIGVLISVYSIFPLMLGVYSGRVSDRYGARRPMLAGTLVIGMGLLLAFLWPYLPTLYVSAVLVGIGFVFYNVSNQNLAGGLGGAAERTHNFATVGLGYAGGQLLGPVIAGYAIEYLGYTYGYLIFSALTLAPAALLAFDKRLDIRRPSGAAGPRNTLALLREPKLRRAILVSGFIVTGWDLFAFYVPIYGHSIELSASTIGNILGVFAAATFIVRALLARITRRFGIETVLATAAFSAALLFLPFPFVEYVPALFGLSFCIGLALGCSQPLTLNLAYNHSPAGRSGEVTGLRLTVNNIMHVGVPVAAGAVGAALGVAPVFWASAVLVAVSGHLSRKAARS